MTIGEIRVKGNTMTKALGMENKSVQLFWKAFEERRYMACLLHLKSKGF